jgi:hypothetical protein
VSDEAAIFIVVAAMLIPIFLESINDAGARIRKVDQDSVGMAERIPQAFRAKILGHPDLRLGFPAIPWPNPPALKLVLLDRFKLFRGEPAALVQERIGRVLRRPIPSYGVTQIWAEAPVIENAVAGTGCSGYYS